MIVKELINPESIVVVGASNNIHKPGGSILHNILTGSFKGSLYAVNPNQKLVQELSSFGSIDDLPQVELAVLAIPAKQCPQVIKGLAQDKGTKAFIVISAGFGEETPEGLLWEKEMVAIVNQFGASLIGPNCIGILNRYHQSVFTQPIPKLDSQGIDLISSSGATAVFILEAAILKGLKFNSVWSVGNAPHIGVEDILQYMDENFSPEDSRVKLLYIENIRDPDRLLFHASSLRKKGCRIAAIKAGSSESGMRAASSHTGALASPDSAVEALFRKAGIVRCYSREELATVGAIFKLKELKGNNFAVITHAGGPGVMITDALSKGGLNVPLLGGPDVEELKSQLLSGSSVANPIDILATGTPAHLKVAMEFCEKREDIDALFVILGTPGLRSMDEMYQMLHQQINRMQKPVFPVLPSIHTAGKEVGDFLQKGHVNFADEVTVAAALSRVINTPEPPKEEVDFSAMDIRKIREIVGELPDGYITPEQIRQLLSLARIPLIGELVSNKKEFLVQGAVDMGFPIVAKVVGPLHKIDVQGVVLNIESVEHLEFEFERLMRIKGATGVLIQPMLKGTELFIGAKYEEGFGHVIFCGLGGIFVEALNDTASGLAPLSHEEARSMVRSLKSYKIIKGARGGDPVNEDCFIDIIVRLSVLLRFIVEVKEMDLNPLIAVNNRIAVVDSRIFIEKKNNS